MITHKNSSSKGETTFIPNYNFSKIEAERVLKNDPQIKIEQAHGANLR
jgi:hypothetical protein